MKKFALIALTGLALILINTSCEKEDLSPNYPFVIQVKTFDDSIRVPNAYVEIFAPVQNSLPYFEAYTNEDGKISDEYDKEAIFLIRATRGHYQDPTHIGCTELRLLPNETVEKTVYIKEVDPEVPGC